MRSIIPRLCVISICAALAAPPAPAQQGGATVKVTGRVSPVVAISAAPPARAELADVHVSASNAGAHALTLSLSGQGRGATRIDVPLRLRSNVGFTLAASCITKAATLAALSVAGVGGGGRFVHPDAAKRVEVVAAFNGRPGRPAWAGGVENLSSRTAILSGPPISTSGTLNSPDNYIEVVLRVVLNAQDAGGLGMRKFRSQPRPITSSFAATPSSFTARSRRAGSVAGIGSPAIIHAPSGSVAKIAFQVISAPHALAICLIRSLHEA